VKTFEIDVQAPDGKKKIWTMNLTSQRAVASVYGADTKAWVGKTVRVYTSQQNVHGHLKMVIYAHVPGTEVTP